MYLVKFKREKKDFLLQKKYKKSKIIYIHDILFDKEYFNDNSENLLKLDLKTHKIYKDLISIIAKKINFHYNLNKNDKSYEFLFGYWLSHFIQQAYHKFLIIKKILAKKKKVTFLVNKNSSYLCYSSMDYFKNILSDEYNQYLFDEILKSMKVNKVELKNINLTKNYSINRKFFFFDKLILIYIKLFSPKYIFVDPYFKKNSIFRKIKFILNSRFKVFFYNYVR